MDKEQFIGLNLQERIQLLWNEGEVISERRYYDCNITLFLLDHFFVEVFHRAGSGEITAVTLQENVDILYAYASEVSLKELEHK